MSEMKLKLDAFEGPLDLLLHLIEKDKIDIYDIPIVEVTQQYINYLKNMQEFDMELASEFLVMAATLLQIKSRMLLPDDKEEEEEEEDPRQRLVEMLVEYRRIKKCAAALLDMKRGADLFGQRKAMFGDMCELIIPAHDPEALLEALAQLVQGQQVQRAYVEPQAYSVQDKMVEILQYLERQPHGFMLNELFKSGSSGEKVAAFLGVLELLKLKAVMITQSERFAPIYVFPGKAQE
ncbi:MAG: segregation/condensation protein A [Phascolarctobacterium sp.]|nr:segregation/condensation protein A [Phascolarctobacterium sp.]